MTDGDCLNCYHRLCGSGAQSTFRPTPKSWMLYGFNILREKHDVINNLQWSMIEISYEPQPLQLGI